MFQAFVILCTLGTNPSYENCKASIQPSIWPSEGLCFQALTIYLDTINDMGTLNEYEIHNIGCHSYLTEDKLKI